MVECEICGEVSHEAEAHGNALTVFDPCLHTEEEFVELWFSEAACYGADVASLRDEWDADKEKEFANEYLDEIVDAIASEGYCVTRDCNAWCVFDSVV